MWYNNYIIAVAWTSDLGDSGHRKKDLTSFRNSFTINNVYTSGLAQYYSDVLHNAIQREPQIQISKRVPEDIYPYR